MPAYSIGFDKGNIFIAISKPSIVQRVRRRCRRYIVVTLQCNETFNVVLAYFCLAAGVHACCSRVCEREGEAWYRSRRQTLVC